MRVCPSPLPHTRPHVALHGEVVVRHRLLALQQPPGHHAADVGVRHVSVRTLRGGRCGGGGGGRGGGATWRAPHVRRHDTAAWPGARDGLQGQEGKDARRVSGRRHSWPLASQPGPGACECFNGMSLGGQLHATTTCGAGRRVHQLATVAAVVEWTTEPLA